MSIKRLILFSLRNIITITVVIIVATIPWMMRDVSYSFEKQFLPFNIIYNTGDNKFNMR